MNSTGSRHRRRTFSPSTATSREARAFARHAIAELGQPVAGDRVEVLVGEMAVNAVLHARTEYVVAISAPRPGVIRVEVSDGVTDLPRTRAATGKDVLMHGRGLALIEAMADRWEVEPTAEGKRVWAEVDD